MSKSSTPASSDSSVTSIPIGTSDTTAVPPCVLKVSLKIDNIRQSATPDFRDSNKLDAAIDGNLPNNLVAPPIFTDILSEKLSYSSRRDVYMRCWINLAADSVSISAPQFVDLDLSIIYALDKCASLWTPPP